MTSDLYALIAQIVPVLLIVLLFEGWMKPLAGAPNPMDKHRRLQRYWRALALSILTIMEIHAVARAAGDGKPDGFGDVVTVLGLWGVMGVILIATVAHRAADLESADKKGTIALASLGALLSGVRLAVWFIQ